MPNVQGKQLPEMCQTTFWHQPKSLIPLCMQVHLRLQVVGVEQAVSLEEELSNHQTPLPIQNTVSSAAMPSVGLYSQCSKSQCEFTPLSISTEQRITIYFE